MCDTLPGVLVLLPLYLSVVSSGLSETVGVNLDVASLPGTQPGCPCCPRPLGTRGACVPACLR